MKPVAVILDTVTVADIIMIFAESLTTTSGIFHTSRFMNKFCQKMVTVITVPAARDWLRIRRLCSGFGSASCSSESDSQQGRAWQRLPPVAPFSVAPGSEPRMCMLGPGPVRCSPVRPDCRDGKYRSAKRCHLAAVPGGCRDLLLICPLFSPFVEKRMRSFANEGQHAHAQKAGMMRQMQ